MRVVEIAVASHDRPAVRGQRVTVVARCDDDSLWIYELPYDPQEPWRRLAPIPGTNAEPCIGDMPYMPVRDPV